MDEKLAKKMPPKLIAVFFFLTWDESNFISALVSQTFVLFSLISYDVMLPLRRLTGKSYYFLDLLVKCLRMSSVDSSFVLAVKVIRVRNL